VLENGYLRLITQVISCEVQGSDVLIGVTEYFDFDVGLGKGKSWHGVGE